MDRTAKRLRRTFLCAVFACPAAVWRLSAAWTVQAALLLPAVRPVRRPWYPADGRKKGASAAVAVACCAEAAMRFFACRSLPAALHPACRVLCVMSGHVLLCFLLDRSEKRRVRRAALTLLVLAAACLA